MALSFNPKSEDEIKADAAKRGPWPKGNYDFEVVNYANEISSKGNPMIKLALRVFHPDGTTRMVFDYLLPAMEFKLRHACECMGLMQQYESGELDAEDFDGRNGKLALNIRKGTGDFPDQNVVADYLKPDGGAAAPARMSMGAPAQSRGGKASSANLDDEIPF